MSEKSESQRGSVVQVHDIRDWDRVVSETLMPLSMGHHATSPAFSASVTAGMLDGVRLALVRVGAHVAERTQRLAAAGDPRFWLGLQLEGTSTLEQGGRRSVLQPGDFALYDSSMPYRREFEGESETFIALIPQQQLTLPPRVLASASGAAVNGREGFARVVSGFLTSLARSFRDLTPAQGAAAVRAMVELVSTAIAGEIGEGDTAVVGHHATQVRQIRDWLVQRLGDAALTPERIAAAHFISTRQLHALFQEQGTTVGQWLRERRLDMARRDLQDDDGERIADIALRWGFEDPAYFARVFRQSYGTAPRAYRERMAAAREETDVS